MLDKEDSVELKNLKTGLAQGETREEESKGILEPWVWLSIGAMLFLAFSDYIVSLYG